MDRRLLPIVLTPERLWHVARIMGACALAFIGATLIGLTEIYWSLTTAIVVTQPDRWDTR
jgi:uncharacterized membrane protein YccC